MTIIKNTVQDIGCGTISSGSSAESLLRLPLPQHPVGGDLMADDCEVQFKFVDVDLSGCNSDYARWKIEWAIKREREFGWHITRRVLKRKYPGVTEYKIVREFNDEGTEESIAVADVTPYVAELTFERLLPRGSVEKVRALESEYESLQERYPYDDFEFMWIIWVLFRTGFFPMLLTAVALRLLYEPILRHFYPDPEKWLYGIAIPLWILSLVRYVVRRHRQRKAIDNRCEAIKAEIRGAVIGSPDAL